MDEPAATVDHAGTWFADERGIERRLKVTWHGDHRLVVLSIWQGDTCTTTFRLPLGEVPRLVRTLVDSLAAAASGRRTDRGTGRGTVAGRGARHPRRPPPA